MIPQCAIPGEQHWHHLSNPSRTRTGSHPVLVGSGQKLPGYLSGRDGGISVTQGTNRPPETVSAEVGKMDTGGGSGQGRDYGEASRGPRTRNSRRPSLSASRHATAEPKPAPAQGGVVPRVPRPRPHPRPVLDVTDANTCHLPNVGVHYTVLKAFLFGAAEKVGGYSASNLEGRT